MSKIIFNDGEELRNVEIKGLESNLIELNGTTVENESGFKVPRFYNPELFFDYSEFNTVYKVNEYSVIYSNDGSVWVEPPAPPIPTHDVTVSVSWDVVTLEIPESLDVTIFVDDEELEVITLSEENDWQHVYEEIPEGIEYTVDAEDLDEFEKSISGTSISYVEPRPEEPSVQEQLDLLAEMCLDLDDRVYALEEGALGEFDEEEEE